MRKGAQGVTVSGKGRSAGCVLTGMGVQVSGPGLCEPAEGDGMLGWALGLCMWRARWGVHCVCRRGRDGS